MINALYSVILGIVEGVTEFLPISSTGHLMLTARLLGLEQTEFLKSFEIAIQLGAILAVVVLYWRTLLINKELLKRTFAAFLPTALVGFVLYKVIKGYLLENAMIVVWSLLIGGLLIVVFEIWQKRKIDSGENDLTRIPYKNFVLVGIVQSLSVVPGVSRAAATILGGMALGFSRKAIVEFSFLLAIPTMLAATGYDLLKSAGSFGYDQIFFLAIGFITAFLTALLAVKFLLNFIKKHTFIIFGVYRIVVSIMFWFMA